MSEAGLPRAFRQRRCLILADGFYEWQKTADRKQPFLIHLKDGSPFAFAGLWERWKRGEQAINSCSIIVTEPNAVLEPIHDRMPVILAKDINGSAPLLEGPPAYQPRGGPGEALLGPLSPRAESTPITAGRPAL
jgi:hypothetical protein